MVGSAGYAAGELLRLICIHPEFTLSAAGSESHAKQPVESVHPHLARQGLGTFVSYNQALEKLMNLCKKGHKSALVLALEHGKTMNILPNILASAKERGADFPVIDISGDFRLKDKSVFQKAYDMKHTSPALLEKSVYGLPELNLEKIKGAKLIANPGCFATATTLALLPLASKDLLKDQVAVTAYTGSSGSGAHPKPSTHHPYRAHNLFAYKPLAHQHEPEILASLSTAGSSKVELSFVTHSAPIVRGIYVTAHIRLPELFTKQDLLSLYEQYYKAAPFVSISENIPHLGEVVGTNVCKIGFAVKKRNLIVFSVIDNLVKGAAGQAIQNLNIIADLEETTGLDSPAVWPG